MSLQIPRKMRPMSLQIPVHPVSRPADPVNQPPENPSAAATVEENETNELADPSAPSEPHTDQINQPPENPSAAAVVEEIQKSTDLGNEMTYPEKSDAPAPSITEVKTNNIPPGRCVSMSRFILRSSSCGRATPKGGKRSDLGL